MKKQFCGIPLAVLPLAIVLSALAGLSVMAWSMVVGDPWLLMIAWALMSIVLIRRFHRRYQKNER